jgi:4-hydroxy-3-methylbut-2-enyl diphosphate reductase
MKSFEIPTYYRSSIIGRVKELRKRQDPRKKDFTPTLLDFGPVRFYIARHFGFCYGVENAIEISYRAVDENPGKKIYLLSQMIHNPLVNEDLEGKGISFIMDTHGKMLISWDEINAEDVVIIPAFGTTIEIENKLKELGVETQAYNTTCPFVERVWKRAEKLGSDEFSIIIHGKAKHEETRATFSHSYQNAPSLIIKDKKDAEFLGEVILGTKTHAEFYDYFENRYSEGFDVTIHLEKIGVINQTTMLASETQELAEYLKQIMVKKYGEAALKNHFADTRDTLCYATNDNQQATYGLLEKSADLAIVVGGYNSSNTSHIVELCEQQFPTYFISSANDILSFKKIQHFNYHKHELLETERFLPKTSDAIDIVLTSGASCPDTALDEVMLKLLSYHKSAKNVDDVLKDLEQTLHIA